MTTICTDLATAQHSPLPSPFAGSFDRGEKPTYVTRAFTLLGVCGALRPDRNQHKRRKSEEGTVFDS